MDTESVFDDMDVEEDLNDISMHEGEVGIWDGQAADASMENLGLSSDGDISEDASEVEVLTLSHALFGPAQADGETHCYLSL